MPLAGLVGAPLCAQNPLDAVAINRDAVTTLLGMLSRGQRLVFATSNSGYGIGEKDRYCTEESPLRPGSLYGTTKVEPERATPDTANAIPPRPPPTSPPSP